MILTVPLDPDAETARELLVRELSEARYREAEPTWFDDLVARVLDRIGKWIDALSGGAGGLPSLGWLIVVALILALVGVAYLVYGPPRLGRRSAGVRPVFGADDTRDATAIRRAAASAAASGDWALAVEERFRAIVRALSDRALLTAHPGTTATGIASGAGRAFPALADRFAYAARLFDGVRYLGEAGSEADYLEMTAFDEEVGSFSLRTDLPVDATAPR